MCVGSIQVLVWVTMNTDPAGRWPVRFSSGALGQVGRLRLGLVRGEEVLQCFLAKHV